MDSNRAPLATLAALLALWWLHMHHFLQRLPERVATHFGGAGAANGWMPRQGLGAFNLIFLVSVLAGVIGTAFLVRFLPTRFINVPHRDYWFAPQRQRESHARMFAHMLWLACLMVAFLVAVNQVIFIANLRPGQPRLPGTAFVTLMVCFLLAIVAWGIRLHRMFPRPPSTTELPRS